MHKSMKFFDYWIIYVRNYHSIVDSSLDQNAKNLASKDPKYNTRRFTILILKRGSNEVHCKQQSI